MTKKSFIAPPGSTMPGAQAAGFVDPSGAQPQAQVNLNPSDLDDIKCECGNYTFIQVVLLKRVSALLTPNGQEALTGHQVFACYACGKIPDTVEKGLAGWFKSEGATSNSSDIVTTDLPDLQKVEIPDESDE